MHRIPLIVEDYQLSHSTENVIVDDSYAALSKRDTELRYKPALLVWKDGFLDKELKQHFSRPNWPVDLVKAFGPSEWRWIMKYPEEGELVNESMLILEKAAGLHGRPDGNIHLTLELRSYDVRDSDVGGLNWWRSRASAVRGRTELGDLFVNRLLEVLSEVECSGGSLFVEQLSIIISKDGTASQGTLTPFLHSDMYYGVRETAITSLLESGWEGHGGALFMPDVKMAQFGEDDESIGLQNTFELACEHSLWRTYSGDILIYDGQIKEGKACGSRGIPHISPDQPGRSSRLCVLMHHKSCTVGD
ncbi:hypothetical protein ACPA1H_20855 [Ectopseudomonas chengduensis]|nr:hypothetical protein [Pseudomonas chengduensis]MDH1281560.1 hypothetical protein [Pseudomonas chengduensis]